MWGKRAGLLAFAICAGCGGSPMPHVEARLPIAQTEVAKCRVAASTSSPLVTEWPASEKANLEARLREGAVAVQYTGCKMRILTGCFLPGQYRWERTTVATDRLEIDSVDDLYAKLPLGAVSLEGELKRSGALAVETTVAGRMQLAGANLGNVPTSGGCAAATHIVDGLAVGAFRLESSGKASARAEVDLKVVEDTGAKTSSEKALLRSAGNPDRCYDSSDQAPDVDCGSPIQLFLYPLPGRAAEEGPTGTLKVDFHAASGDSVWQVIANNQTICTTPCSKWLHPSTAIVLEERKAWARDEHVEVPSLLPYSNHGSIEVHAHGTSFTKMTVGTTLTALSGMAVITGITLAAVGCSSEDRGGMCTAGAITGPAGVVGLVPGILLILNSRAKAEILSADSNPF